MSLKMIVRYIHVIWITTPMTDFIEAWRLIAFGGRYVALATRYLLIRANVQY